MIPMKKVARNWSFGLALLIAPSAWADNKPKSSPAPKPAAHPAAKANSRTAPAGHAATTNSGASHPTVNHPGTAAHTGASRTGAAHPTTTTPHAGAAGSHFRSGPSTTRTFSNGTTARFSAGGRIQSIHTARGVTINRLPGGRRTIAAERNGRTLVSTGPNSGYMQRAYLNRNGREYVQRTYVVGGRTSVYVYNRYSYRGGFYYGYVPAFYFGPAFYGWAFDPWASPVYYRWGWRSAAWYAPYNYYFAPAPYYPVASLWLTDYLLAESLRASSDASSASLALQAQSGAQADQSTAQNTVLTPEIKQAIADEVKRQIDAERAAAVIPRQPAATASAPAQTPEPRPAAAAPAPTQVAEERPAALDPAVSVFVVSSNLDVTAGDQGCSLSPGDVITRLDNTPDAKQNVGVKVATSKRSDCPAGERVVVAVADLQEMHNQFRAKIDSGLKMLADNQGQNGLPPAPDTQTVAGDVPPPAADTVRVDLQNLRAEADQAEADVKSQNAAAGRS